MMPFLFAYFLLVLAVVGIFANQLIIRNENRRINSRIDVIVAGVRTARRNNIKERRRLKGRPMIRNRELMEVGRRIARGEPVVPNINLEEIDQQQDA